MTASTIRPRGTTECSTKIVKADGRVIGQLAYGHVFGRGIEGAIADLKRDSANPDEWDKAEIRLDLSGTTEVLCTNCGLMWRHPQPQQTYLCPSCGQEVSE